MARVVVPGVPYYITHRGNQRRDVFHYVELNPVRAGTVRRAESGPLLDSQRPFGGRRPDPLSGSPLTWLEWLTLGVGEAETESIRRATMTGRPCGEAAFIRRLEAKSQRILAPKKRGPKPRERSSNERCAELFPEMPESQFYYVKRP